VAPAADSAPGAAVPASSIAAPQPGTDPRVQQRQFLAAAQALLALDGSPLSMQRYGEAQARLHGLLESTDSADSVHLALALLDLSHAPAQAFAQADAVPGSGQAGDGGSRTRERALAATGFLEQAVAANPANLSALWHLAFLLESFDDARAVEVWRQLVAQASEHLQALVRLAEGLLLLEDHAQAQEIGERALALAEERGDDVSAGRARNVLGRAYLHQGQYQLAETMFKKAAVSTPGSRWGCAYQSLGQLYTTLGEVDLPPIEDGSD